MKLYFCFGPICKAPIALKVVTSWIFGKSLKLHASMPLVLLEQFVEVRIV